MSTETTPPPPKDEKAVYAPKGKPFRAELIRPNDNWKCVEESYHVTVQDALARLEQARAYYGGGIFRVVSHDKGHPIFTGEAHTYPPGPPPASRGEKRSW